MKGAQFNRLAERELAEAIAYYEEQSKGLGGKFLDEVQGAVTLLRQYPLAAPRISGSIRRFVLPRFPYYLLYRPLRQGEIRILAVAHQKRHPRYWVGRN